MSHFFLIPTFKEFIKSTNICQSYSKNKRGPVFLTHSVYHNTQMIVLITLKVDHKWLEYKWVFTFSLILRYNTIQYDT